VEQSFIPQAEEKGLRLSVVVSPTVPPVIVTDAQRLQQILRNLISNAVKFTDAGSVTLTMDLAPEVAAFGVPALDAAEGVIAFTVEDTGIGIPDEKLALIFEAFQQADGTTSRRYGGTGLGLSISRSLAVLLGGTITVSSTPDHGSRFTVLLPTTLLAEPQPPLPGQLRLGSTGFSGIDPVLGDLALPPSDVGERGSWPSVQILRPTVAERRDSASAAGLEGATVLIIDDDVRNVFALTSALELHGMTVLYADNGVDGVRLLTEHPRVDIVLMDAMMPGQDGNETTRIIRRNPRFAGLPVVFLTAKAMPGDRESSLAAGASDYITKPVDLDMLIEGMAAWLGETGSSGEPGSSGDAGEDART